MADAIVSALVERIIAMVEEQIRNEINLVRGVDTEILKLSEEMKRLRNVLNDAENRRFKDKNINYWLSRLEQTSYEMEDVLDEWSYALLKYNMDQSNPPKQKVCSFVPSSSCLCFKKVVVRRDIANKIKNVKERLDQILKEKDQYNFITSLPTMNPSPESWRVQSTSLIDLGIRGRDKDKDILVSKLMGNSGGQNELDNLQVVSIVGVGGLGKTTLAQLVYNDSRVKGCFELRIWICVSDPFDLSVIAKGILESLGKGNSSHTNQLDILFKHIQDSISGKRFLLVLDDVWSEDYNKWELLEKTLGCGGVGSKILVTTRNERVARIMHTIHVHRPGQLSDEDCWLVLHRMTLFGKTKEVVEIFEDIGRKIAKKCKGLPLAAKVMGSLLCFKNTLGEWENILNSEIWKMEEAEVNLFPHLLLSYNELSPTLKRCFSYCAVFPKDEKIHVDELIRSWMALGYLGSEEDVEGKGRRYFDILMMHSLFQDFEKDDSDGRIKSCKMHDIVHDFAQFLRKSGKVEATGMKKTTCQTCDPLLVSSVNEFCTLVLVLRYDESPPNLCDCLKRLRVLSLERKGLESIPQGIENMIHLRSLSLFEIKQLSPEALKIIFQLYNLQTLCLVDCNLEEIPMEVKNLIHLRHLNLRKNESLKELPREIGNLIQLRHLNLSWNTSLKELPREIGDLIQLRHLDLSVNKALMELPREIGKLTHLTHLNLQWNHSLKELPESICALNLPTLDVLYCFNMSRLPEGVGQLISLRTLGEFHGGIGGSKLGSLKNLNNLSGTLRLIIRLNKDTNIEEAVEDAEEAQLRNKIGIQRLDLWFEDEMDDNEKWSMVIDALEPHPKLEELRIEGYMGSQLPLGWLVSPLNQLRSLQLKRCNHLTSLPPFGKLPCLEHLSIRGMRRLEIVGRELLGIGRGGDMGLDTVAFPKLKVLTFQGCSSWKEWEDITIQGMTLMPCLTQLTIADCQNLTALPHGLLRKVSSLQMLYISGSRLLEERYRDKDGSDWKSISQYNPHFHHML